MEYQYVWFFLLKKKKKKKRKKENLAYYLCIPIYPLFLEWEKLFGIAILLFLENIAFYFKNHKGEKFCLYIMYEKI